MTCYQKISCPECCSTDIMKAGFTGQGKQRYRCRNLECDKSHFLLDYTYRAWVPGIKKQAIDMAINGSGIRDTARVLKIARNTISSTIKKAKTRVHVNSNFFFHASNKDREVRLSQACVEAEVDEQWSNACNKSDQGWLWHAVCHEENTVLAYVFGKRKDDVFRKLQALLSPFNITRFYTDNWGSL